MALTATASPGFADIIGFTGANDVLLVPGDPGDAIVEGDALVSTVGEGVLDLAAASEIVVGYATKSVTMAAASVGFPSRPAEVDAANETTLTLVPVNPNVLPGVPIRLVTFSGQLDETIADYTAATPSITMTTGTGSDDDCNGALIYVYEGTGAGQVNIVAGYVHSTKVATLHRKFEVALDTTSKIIMLEGEAADNRGIGFFGRIDVGDNNNLTTAQGADDGDYVVYLDFRDAARYLSQLKLPVIPATALGHMV